MYASMSKTIEAIKARPVFQKRDLSSAPVSEVAKKMAQFASKHGTAENVEQCATLFYLSSHGFHCLEASVTPTEELTPLKAALAEQHVQRMNMMGLRMFYYILVISAEEMQFGEARNAGLFDFVESNTSAGAAKWLKGVMQRESGRDFFKKTDGLTLGECIHALEMGFRFARWSPGFGGLPWAQIAETAGEVIRGSNSLELMVDKAFTLCHNNGAIFNKGHYYSHYSQQFYQLLDIQASGQIPGAIHSKLALPGINSPAARELHAQFAKVFPEEFNTAYDPGRVKSMESVRQAKQAAAAKKASAFLSSGGGWGGPSAPQEKGPPSRPCDNLLDMEQYQGFANPSKGGFFG